MSAQRVLGCLGLFVLLGLTGCVSAPTRLYQLDAGSMPLPSRADGPVVLLGPLSMADYLKREQLVQRQANGILDLSGEARWAGNLEVNINQQLLRLLSSKLNTNHLLLFNEKTGISPQVQITLSISRLDSGPKVPAVLEARWRLFDQQGALRDSRLFSDEEAHTGSIEDQVRAQSALLRRLSTELAKSLPLAMQPISKQPDKAVHKSANNRGQSNKTKEQGPKMPVAAPISPDTYRF